VYFFHPSPILKVPWVFLACQFPEKGLTVFRKDNHINWTPKMNLTFNVPTKVGHSSLAEELKRSIRKTTY
jgi:hypothetical protein